MAEESEVNITNDNHVPETFDEKINEQFQNLKAGYRNGLPITPQETAALMQYMELFPKLHQAENLLMHDAMGVIGSRLNAFVYQILPDQGPAIDVYGDIARNEALIEVDKRVDAAKQLNKIAQEARRRYLAVATEERIAAFDLTGNRPLIMERALPQIDLLDIVVDSVAFLEEPTADKYEQLQAHTIGLDRLAAATGNIRINNEGEVPFNPSDISINGVETIILVNLIANARRHAIPFGVSNSTVTIHLSDDNQGIMVTNPSEQPIPQNAGELGVKGQQGSSGFGRFITNIYATLEGITVADNRDVVEPYQGQDKSGYLIKAWATPLASLRSNKPTV